jgi:hypothetical protein
MVSQDRSRASDAHRSCGLLYLAALIGVVWGKSADWIPSIGWGHWSLPAHSWGLTVLVALALSGVAGARSAKRGAKPTLHLGIFVYMLFLFLWDPFLFVQRAESACVGLSLIFPLLLAIPLQVRSRDRLATSGTILFLIASIAAMMHNAQSFWGGTGFWGGWVV